MKKDKGISRRQFVSGTLGVAAASLVPGAALVSRAAAAQDAPAVHSTRVLDQSPIADFADSDWKSQGVLNLKKSPYAKLRTVPPRAVTIGDGLWGTRREINVSKSIPSMHELLEAHGRMNNFRRLIKGDTSEVPGPVYRDSDVYKWTEAVGWELEAGDRPELRETTEKIIDDVVAAQQPNGYLNTYFVGPRASLSMTPQTQSTGHELYNMGHMLQGSIAFYRATGERKMLDAGIRFVDDFLIPGFGPAPKKPIISGHPEIEMSLIELYRITGDKRQLDLAGYILHGDDRISFPPSRLVYMFCGIPFTTRTKLEGHAVRCMYACCGATDYYMETGDPDYFKTLNTLWTDLVTSKMYVTGGVGARGAGEAFGDPYELPNLRAYGESCAAIGNMMWNWRMLHATAEAKFTDVIERTLYNGINSGMSLDGTLYCYRNPLEFDPSSGGKIRNPWYDTTCCPPNLERTFASLPGYFYSTSQDGIYVHLFHNSQLDWHLENGIGLKIEQKTNYPWDGVVELTVTPAQTAEFTLHLRVPAWTRTAHVSVNGKPVPGVKPGEYLALRREWRAGEKVRMALDMAPQLLAANPQLTDDAGRVAVQRGTLIYCMEGMDQQGASLDDVAVVVPGDAAARAKSFHPQPEPDLLGGVTVLKHEGAAFTQEPGHDPLYFRYGSLSRATKPAPLTFIPYYAWSNREQTPMEVWTPFIKA